MKKFTLKDILSSAAKWEPPEKREPTPKKVVQSEKKPVKPAKIPEKTDYSREFIKKFNSLAASKSRWTIWGRLCCSVCLLHFQRCRPE